MAEAFDMPIIGRIALFIAHNTPNALTGIKSDQLVPLGATPTAVYAVVDPLAPFNNGATARMGFSAGGNEWAASIDLTTGGEKRVATWMSISPLQLASAREVWVDLQDGGTPPTQGRALFVVEYVW